MNQELECKEIQDIGLEIIHCIDRFAKENKIRYYMAGGTLLGAVRHQGYIPWDDDVDLMMPRPDYEQFIRSFHMGRFCVSSCETDSDYNTPFARVWDPNTSLTFSTKEKTIGVFVDIFPIDGYPQNEIISHLHLYRIKIIRSMISAVIRQKYYENEKFIIIKRLLHKVLKHDGNYYCNRLTKVALKYSFDSSAYVGVTTTLHHLFRERNSKDIFNETVFLPFEDMMLPAPVGYKTYLEKLYGNYMQLPPEDKRKTEHLFRAYRKAREGE